MLSVVKRILPRPVKRVLRRALENVQIRRHLKPLKRRLERVYGDSFVMTIHPRDEMALFVRDLAGPLRGAEYYFESGEQLLKDLEELVRAAGRPLERVTSLLEFACGYGRLTRFLVRRATPARIVVSDIDHDAVEFVRRTFGVRGFDSVADPERLQHRERYEVIVVVSLFSHLSEGVWTAWARRLSSMLVEGGLLVFSTNGRSAYESLDAERRRQLEAPVPGFHYRPFNETRGRLAGDLYGTTYVTEEYVRRVFTPDLGVRMAGVHPGKLFGGAQDVYVIERSGERVLRQAGA